MDNPGYTIFQGGGSIQMDNSIQRLEEEEDLQDQRRRNAELAKQLDNAFDDLIDDDENETMNSFFTEEQQQQNHNNNNNENNGPIFENRFVPPQNRSFNNQFTKSDGEVVQQVAQLKQRLESRTREFEHVTRLLHEETKKHEALSNSYEKKLSLAIAEKERANLTRTQTHELLVEAKTEIANYEEMVGGLREKINQLNEKNTGLVAELECTKTSLSDAMHRYRMVEQNSAIKADKHVDALLKQTEEKHNAKVAMMQQQIDNLRGKLDDKIQDYKTLEARYNEIQKSREALLIDKSEMINHLSQNLEDSQKQCQKLMEKTMSHPTLVTENLRLKKVVGALECQTEDMQKTINNLTTKLDQTNQELDSLVVGPSGGGGDNETNFSPIRKNGIGSTPMNPNIRNSEDRMARMKNELYVCMNTLQEKRDEIKKLKSENDSKDFEIDQIRQESNEALVQVNQYKDELFRLTNKSKLLENELNKLSGGKTAFDVHEELEDKIFNLRTENDELGDKYDKLTESYNSLKGKYDKAKLDLEKLDVMNIELEKQKFLLKDAQKECDRIKNMYIEISSKKDDLSREIKEFKRQDTVRDLDNEKDKVTSLERALKLADVKVTELNKLLDKEKIEHEAIVNSLKEKYEKENLNKSSKNASNTCTKCIDLLSEISKHEIENLQLQHSCMSHLKDLNSIKQELQKARSTISDLQHKLELKVVRDQEINDLKEKAAQFAEFIEKQSNLSSKDVSTSPLKNESRDQSVSTSPDISEMETRKKARETEQKVREEMAKAFAQEIKLIEDKFKEQYKKFEENMNILKNELIDKCDELDIKTQEVEILKHAILTERTKMSEFSAKRDEYAKSLFDKQTEILQKCKTELENCNRKVVFLEKELKEKQELIENERQSMEKIVRQFSEERKSYQQREMEVLERYTEFEIESRKNLNIMEEKYKSVKKTLMNYKTYSEEKEQHMLKEYDRIKEGYQAAKTKMQNQLEDALDRQRKKYEERMSQLEADKKMSVKNS